MTSKAPLSFSRCSHESQQQPPSQAPSPLPRTHTAPSRPEPPQDVFFYFIPSFRPPLPTFSFPPSAPNHHGL